MQSHLHIKAEASFYTYRKVIFFNVLQILVKISLNFLLSKCPSKSIFQNIPQILFVKMSLKFSQLKFQFSFPLLVAFWWINQQVECWSVLGEGGEVLLKFNFVQTLSAAVWGRRETNNKFYRSSTAGLAFYLQDANFAIFFFFESHLHDCIFSHFLLIFRCDLRDEVLRDALRPEGRWRFVRRWHNDYAEMERWMTRCYFTHFRLTRKRDTGGEKPPWISLKAKRTDMFRCWLSEDKFNVWEIFILAPPDLFDLFLIFKWSLTAVPCLLIFHLHRGEVWNVQMIPMRNIVKLLREIL